VGRRYWPIVTILTPTDLKSARDTLRLEAGLMLYGNDMDENTTPLEVPLKWTVKLENKDFIGKKALLAQQLNRKLVGFEVLEKKRIARHGNEVQYTNWKDNHRVFLH